MADGTKMPKKKKSLTAAFMAVWDQLENIPVAMKTGYKMHKSAIGLAVVMCFAFAASPLATVLWACAAAYGSGRIAQLEHATDYHPQIS